MKEQTNIMPSAGNIGRRGAVLSISVATMLGARSTAAQTSTRVTEIPTPTPGQRDELDLIIQDLLYDATSPVLGNPNGDVTIVEFFDYRCPYCKVMAPRLVTLMSGDHGVRLVMKEYPILSRESIVAAHVALALAQRGKYQAFHEAMYALAGPFDETTIFDVVRSVGLDPAPIGNEMKAPDIEAEVRRNLALGRIIGLQGTPAFVIGRGILPGAASLDALKKLIAAERKKQHG